MLMDRLSVTVDDPASSDPTISEEPKLIFEKQPLYLSDEEDDIQWQRDNDLIDLKTYEALMKELDFQNSEVQFAEEYASENFHY